MDAADLEPIRTALQSQSAVIDRHEQLLQDMKQQLTLLFRAQTEGVQPASAAAPAPALAPNPPPLLIRAPFKGMLWLLIQRGMLWTQRPVEGSCCSAFWCLSSNPPGSPQRGPKWVI